MNNKEMERLAVIEEQLNQNRLEHEEIKVNVGEIKDEIKKNNLYVIENIRLLESQKVGKAEYNIQMNNLSDEISSFKKNNISLGIKIVGGLFALLITIIGFLLRQLLLNGGLIN